MAWFKTDYNNIVLMGVIYVKFFLEFPVISMFLLCAMLTCDISCDIQPLYVIRSADMDWGMFGAISALFAVNITIMLWLFNKLDGDIKTVANDMKTIAADYRADSIAMNSRVDLAQAALNARIDTTQSILMRMLEKQGR